MTVGVPIPLTNAQAVAVGKLADHVIGESLRIFSLGRGPLLIHVADAAEYRVDEDGSIHERRPRGPWVLSDVAP